MEGPGLEDTGLGRPETGESIPEETMVQGLGGRHTKGLCEAQLQTVSRGHRGGRDPRRARGTL